VDRMQLLKQISFGARVAEDETNELESYFVETDQWDRIFGGEIDVVKGEKGAGKSAIYSLLSTKSDALFDKRILLITAEEPRGAPVFKELVTDPPPPRLSLSAFGSYIC
jgi:predicted ATP-dependent serine protease